jgi:hypothetical protein
MYNNKKKFLGFAYTDLDKKDTIVPHMPFYHKARKNTKKVKEYALSSVSEKSMHEIIFGGKAPSGYWIDHENSEGLDNRRENLRLATYGANGHNRTKLEGTTSEYFGVYLKRGKWSAQITFERKTYRLGTYTLAEDAAKIRDVYAVHFYKDIAQLNMKDGKYFLSKEEVEDILKNGIPEIYKIKMKETGLPKNIRREGDKFAYVKTYDNVKYRIMYDTLEEAEEGLRELIEEKEQEKRKLREEIENSIVRNKDGIAVLYGHNRNGEIDAEWRVDDEVWKKFIHNSWSKTVPAVYGHGYVNEIVDLLHIHIWTTFRGPVPEGMTVDHVNSKDPTDVRLSNLRLADMSLQQHNKESHKKSLSRYKGISISRGMFLLRFKDVDYGRYYYEEDAIIAYNKIVTDEYGANAKLNPVPNTRTCAADYFSNMSIEFLESLVTVQDIQEVFYMTPHWGIKCNDVNGTNFKKYQSLAIKMRLDDIKNNVQKEKLPDFTVEFIQSIKTVRGMRVLFKDRPDWKKRHNIAPNHIFLHNLEQHRLLALQSKREELENIPVNNNFKPLVSKMKDDEQVVLGTETDINNIQLPYVPPIAITPMKEVQLALENRSSTNVSAGVPSIMNSKIDDNYFIEKPPDGKRAILKIIKK